jgi:hypothetical protein
MAEKPRSRPAAPKIGATRVPPHPKPADPGYCDWLVDEGSDASFPASDPSAITQPHPKPAKRPVQGSARVNWLGS